MAGTREEVNQMAATLYSVCTGKRLAVVLDAMRLVEIQLHCKKRVSRMGIRTALWSKISERGN